jgi:ABC-2 type transport system permease protein
MADTTIPGRLPGPVPVLAAQIRYQLTLLFRNPRALVTGLVMPALLLAFELGHVQHLGATAAVLAADLAGVVLVLVSVEMAKLRLTGHAAAAMLVTGTLGALAFAAAGTAITRLISTAQSAQPVLMLTYLPLSGAFGPIQSLPHWLTTAVTYLPAQPVVDAVSRALLRSGGTLLPLHDAAVLAAWLTGGLLLSLRFFRWDPHRPRHSRAS